MTDKPKNTGRKNPNGRTIWAAPDGSMYSERTATIQLPSGEWYNIPTVGANGEIMNPLQVQRLYEVTQKMNDFLTGEPLTPFASMEEAELAARRRSESIKP